MNFPGNFIKFIKPLNFSKYLKALIIVNFIEFVKALSECESVLNFEFTKALNFSQKVSDSGLSRQQAGKTFTTNGITDRRGDRKISNQLPPRAFGLFRSPR